MELSPPELLPDGRVQVGVIGTDIKGVGDTFAAAAAEARRLAKQKQPPVKPRRSCPVTPDKEQSAEEQLDQDHDDAAKKYLPVADKLLKEHRLTVSEWRRARLAKTFWEMRELPADTRHKGEEPEAKTHVYSNCEGFVDGKPRYECVAVKPGDPVILHSIEYIEGQAVRRAVEIEPPEPVDAVEREKKYSPVPGLRSAQRHIAKLLEYAEKPPAHKGRVATRCANLRKALLSSGSYGAMELAFERLGENVSFDSDEADYGKLLDSLEAGQVDAAKLERWKARIDRILDRGENWRKVPPPSPLTTRIVKTGWLAWNAAGRRWNEYYQDSRYGKEKLTGPLPDFLRDLITCCNGTHELVRKPLPRTSKYRPPPWPRMGDGLTMTDGALHIAIQTQEAFYRKHVLPTLKKGD